MIGELFFREEGNKLDLLVQVIEALHWAAPIVARSCRTSVENIGFFGPQKLVRNGVPMLVYRLARVYGTDKKMLRESVWNKKAVLLDRQSLFVSKNQKLLRGKKVPWQPMAVNTQAHYGGAACLG